MLTSDKLETFRDRCIQRSFKHNMWVVPGEWKTSIFGTEKADESIKAINSQFSAEGVVYWWSRVYQSLVSKLGCKAVHTIISCFIELRWPAVCSCACFISVRYCTSVHQTELFVLYYIQRKFTIYFHLPYI